MWMSEANLLRIGGLVIENLEFTDVRLHCGRQYVQPHAVCSDRRKMIDALVPDGMTLDHSAPARSRPCPNFEMFDMLSVVKPFHQKCLIETHRFRKRHFKSRAVRPCGCRPECIG